MTPSDGASTEHARYRELASLAATGSLDVLDMGELHDHLATCEECRDVLAQYQRVLCEAIPVLAQWHEHQQAHFLWNEGAARRKLLSAVQKRELARPMARPLKWSLAAAASIAVVSAAAAWHFEAVSYEQRQLASVRQSLDNARTAAETAQNTVRDERAHIANLDAQLARIQAKFAQLRLHEQVSNDQLNETLKSAHDEAENWRQVEFATQQQLQSAIAERDQAESRVHAAQRELQNVQAQLTGLQLEQQKRLDLAASERRSVAELQAINDDVTGKLARAETYLSADRDIRELIGARNLYIADVFDVDSVSRTRRAFGRVFYTKGKSLVFYAFDLDRQRGSTNASFQVWGEKGVARDKRAAALNLGILYLDSEAKRRWTLSFDDPRTLAEIDAVFVTVEPQGGSPRPTGKPFLFAMLRKEVNHP